MPYTNNDDKVFSPALVDLLQSIGAQIDGTFRILISLSGFELKRGNFPSFYKLLSEKQALSIQMVILKESGRRLQPFTFNSGESPQWWSAYNDVKHDLPKGAYSDTYGNVINALGALSVLHRFAAFALGTKGLKPQVLDAKNWSNLIDFWELRDKSDDEIRKRLHPDYVQNSGGYASEVFYSPMIYAPKE